MDHRLLFRKQDSLKQKVKKIANKYKGYAHNSTEAPLENVIRCAIWYHWYNFKKREKHPWRSFSFSKVAGWCSVKCHTCLLSAAGLFK